MWHLRVHAAISGLCTASMIACASGSGATLAPENLDLSGSWVLNVELSDNPREMMQQDGMGGGAMGGRPTGGGRRPGGGGGRPSGGMGGRGGMRGGAPSQMDQQRMQQTIRMATQAPRRIVVDQQDSTITIRDGGGRTLTLHTNWKKVTQEIENDGELDIRARWQERDLQIEREVHDGGKILEEFSISYSGDRLHVEKRLEMGRGGRAQIFHFVYDSER